MKDVEILLRGFAMLIDAHNYAPSMVKFLNHFSRRCQPHSETQNQYLANLFEAFLKLCVELPADAFLKNGRFNVALYEGVFSAVCQNAFATSTLPQGRLTAAELKAVEADPEFSAATIEGTTQTKNVEKRLERARALVAAR